MTTPTPASDSADEAAVEKLGALLEECLRADSAQPGSSAAIVQQAQGQVRVNLEQMLAIGRALRVNSERLAAAACLPDDRAEALRARIMARISSSPPPNPPGA
jgi:hypothetical protein